MPSIVISDLPTSMKSVGISMPYLSAPWTRSRIIAERSISFSGLPEVLLREHDTSPRYSRMSTFLVGRPMA